MANCAKSGQQRSYNRPPPFRKDCFGSAQDDGIALVMLHGVALHWAAGTAVGVACAFAGVDKCKKFVVFVVFTFQNI